MKNIPYFDLFYLKLGNACNFNCRHCSQGSVPKKDPGDSISEDVYRFLDKYIIAHKNKKKSLIRLWGGEPLLYFHHIKKIVLRYKDSFDYTLISNGSLLSQEIVDFLNKNNINFVLSHDGENTAAIRDEDVLKNNNIKKLFDSIKNKSFMSVITAVSPRIDKTIDYFRNMQYEDIYINFVWMINHDGTNEQNELSKIDFEEYRKSVQETIKRFELHINGKGYFPKEHNYISTFLSKIKNGKEKCFDNNCSYIKKCNTCGYYVGDQMLEIDIYGNVYECHNGNNIIGKITDNYLELKEKANYYKDNKKKDLNCKDCDISFLCEGVCPTSTPLGDCVWCSFYKITFEEIIKYLFTFDQK